MIPALLLFVVVAVFAPPVMAQTAITQDAAGPPPLGKAVQVTSGEHEGFTRVVLDFGSAVDWQFGRTKDGYAFRKIGAHVGYDLNAVFDLIGTSRLAAISADPAALNIGMACACHAIAFEFRPGIIVIDLRDGPPPKGSSFEEPLPDFAAQDQPAPAKGTPPVDQGYDWTKRALSQIDAPLGPQLLGDPALQPLRDQMLLQLSRGAATGVVDLELPETVELGQNMPVDGARISLGALPGLTVQPAFGDKPSLGQTGAVCTTAAELAVDSWGSDAPVAEQFSGAFANLLGEFDRPNPEAVEKAVRFLISIGFGLEAGQMTKAFLPDAPMLASLAKIVDGISDEKGFFAGQISCDTPAALWALLAKETVGSGDLVNEKAVVLAFSNLPLHLRRLLGPSVTDRLLRLNKTGAAESIRNAVARAGKTAEVALIEAKLDLSQGNPQSAQKNLEAAIQGAGSAKTAALIGLVDSLVAQGVPIEAKIAEDLAAVERETRGTENATGLTRALALAQASSGDYAAGFETAAQAPQVTAQIWVILSRLGTDSDVLTHAVQSAPDVPQDLESGTATRLAQRLRDLGLPDVAAEWVKAYPQIDAKTRAEIAMDRRDGRSALQSAQQLGGQDGTRLQAEALQLLGDHLAAAQAFSSLKDANAAEFAYAKAGAWAQLRDSPPNVWTPVLAALDAPDPVLLGPLGQGQQLIAHSAQTRAAIADLLAQIPKPTP